MFHSDGFILSSGEAVVNFDGTFLASDGTAASLLPAAGVQLLAYGSGGRRCRIRQRRGCKEFDIHSLDR